MIRSLRSLGTTILLTTHYLDEAQQLADRVAVLRDGVIVRQGSPADLIGNTRTTEIRYVRDGDLVVVKTTEPTRLLNELTAEALSSGRELEHLEVRRPTLEDVYLELVGGGAAVCSLVHQLRFEPKIFWRSREAAVFIFLFPLLLYALLGTVYGDDIDGVPAVDILLAGLFGYGACQHRLRRPRHHARHPARGGCAEAHPGDAASTRRLHAAVLLSTLVTFALEAVALLALGGLAFGASMPANWLGFARLVVLGVG